MSTVAVVGIGALAPGAADPEQLWQVLMQPRPQFRLPARFDPGPVYSPDPQVADRTFSQLAGYIGDFAPHPVLAGELERGLWETADTEVLWLRHTLLQALDRVSSRPGQRAGCYVANWTGATQAAEDTVLVECAARAIAARLAREPTARALHEHRLRTLLRSRYRYAAQHPRMLLPDMLTRRAFSGLLPDSSDWLTVSAACASSLYAIAVGIQRLTDGACDVAFCGSVNGMGRLMAVSAAKFGGLSARGEVRAFDASADGTVFAEAATMVALKRPERARDDGDEILALIDGCGLANDGRGKSIAAPHPLGVRRALERAWTDGEAVAQDIDWVIAHGSGTLAGDQVEIGVLAEAVAPGGTLWCTSNKPAFGHAAWAAGGISLIQAVKALEHGVIPGQQCFAVPNPALAGTGVRVPDQPVAWPGDPARRRVAGVTGMGVGGANAHLLVTDRPARSRRETAPVPEGDDLAVLTAWSAWLPGAPAAAQIRSWLATGDGPPPRSFGHSYPPSALAATRLPPVTLEVIDRSHRMALDAAHRFASEHGEIWAGLRASTGIVLAHHGPTRSWIDVTLRAGAADLQELPWTQDERAALELFLEEVRARQRITDETLAGSVVNLAAARIASRWDLHGPAMAVDTGATSALTAISTGLSDLRNRRLDLVLILALNESATPEAAYLTGHDEVRLAEGAFLLAFTRHSVAAGQGWPVLARIESSTAHQDQSAPDTPDTPDDPDGRDYLGAQGAVTLLRHVIRQERADLLSAAPAATITVIPQPAPAPGQDADPASARRWATTLRRADAVQVREPQPAVPACGVVLVNTAQLASDLADRVTAAGALLLSTDAATPAGPAAVISQIADEASLAPVLRELDDRRPDVRVIASVRRPITGWLAEDASVTRLLELSMLVAKHFGDRLAAGSFTATVLDPLTDLLPHPDGAQFTGFVRSLGWEIPPDQTLALVTDATPEQALEELAAEIAARRDTPVTYYRGGLRHTEVLSPAPLPPAGHQIATLSPEPVIVAVGGARGIAAAALLDLASSHHPTLWILGRSDPGTVPPEILNASGDDQARLRSAFITQGLRPGVTPAGLSRVFDLHWRARQTAATLGRLRALCGPDRVRYLTCDITDPAAVRHAAAAITARHDRIDLLLNSAFQQESAQHGNKHLDAFRRVVATKVSGYRNLKAAFAAAPPRLWCNFGSSIVLLGLAGETDYAAGSEYLAAAARYETRLLGRPTTTICWGLWEQAGSAAAPLARTRLTRAGVTTGISDVQGCAFLGSELAHPGSAEPAPLYLTTADHDLAGRRVPAAIGGPPAPGLLGSPAERNGRSARWAWHLHPAHDRYLLEHLIDGRPALPGMCLAAMAAHAATTLVPDLTVTGLRDIRFHEFAWADPRKPGPTKYRLLAEAAPPVVRVRLLSDVVADGRILRHDRCHATADVLLGPPQTPPRWNGWETTPTARQADPCGQPGSVIHLTGIFRNTVDIQASHNRGYARFQPALAPADILSRSPLPVLMLDALGRTSCFPPIAPLQTALQAPVAIDRIDLYTHGPDSELIRRYPSGIGLYGEPGASRYTAVAPDGTVLAQITGLHSHRLGTQPIIPLPAAMP